LLRLGAYQVHTAARRDLEQYVPRVDKVSAAELLGMRPVIPSAFRLGRCWDPDLLRKEPLNGEVDRAIVVTLRLQQPESQRALTQQLPYRRELGARPSAGVHCDAIDGNVHDRTGTFARVRGVRTI
jgi:hypothetical protein